MLSEDLSVIKWKTLSDLNDVNEIIIQFTSLFLQEWNKHAPMKSGRTRKKHTLWMNKNVLELIQKRNKAYKNYKTSRKSYNQSRAITEFYTYKKLRNAITDTTRRAKRDFFINGAKEGSCHFWKHVKQCTGLGKIKSSINPWPCHDDVTSKISANKLNDSFINSITALKALTVNKFDSLHLRHSIHMIIYSQSVACMPKTFNM